MSRGLGCKGLDFVRISEKGADRRGNKWTWLDTILCKTFPKLESHAQSYTHALTPLPRTPLTDSSPNIISRNE